jgi:hypothetical protein
MTKRLVLAALLVSIALPMRADFGDIARAIDGHHGVHRVWIPLLGIGRFFVRAIAPEGIHDFQLATFEGADKLDPQELHALMQSKAGAGFTPLVKVWSKRSREWSFIYVRPQANDRVELMILTHDSSDTVLIRVEVDANVIAREVTDSPRHVSRVARRD